MIFIRKKLFFTRVAFLRPPNIIFSFYNKKLKMEKIWELLIINKYG